TGRFISKDGFDFGQINNPPSLHLYYYAMANPLRYLDLDGNKPGELTTVQWATRTGEDVFNIWKDYSIGFTKDVAELGANTVSLGGYGGLKQAYSEGKLDEGGAGAGLSAYRHGMSDFLTLGAVSHLEAGGTGTSFVASASGYSNVTGGASEVANAQ